jgi:hypothetical protein
MGKMKWSNMGDISMRDMGIVGRSRGRGRSRDMGMNTAFDKVVVNMAKLMGCYRR